MYNIIINHTAHNDIDSIYSFCCNINIEYALKVKANILIAINALLYFPYATPIYLKIKDVIFREKIVSVHYLIIFSIFQNLVIIHRVYDGRKKIKSTDLINSTI